jgi:hypothetical protein
MKDTLGRNNRSLANKQCDACGSTFRPIRSASRFCSRPCMWSKNGGRNKKPESWWQTSNGYIEGKIWLPDGTQIRVKQHRFVVEGILGRALLSDEDVHHKNGIKTDNRPENLEVMNHGSHTKHTNSNREYARGYKMKLTPEERKARSMRAIAQCLGMMGRAAIAKAKGAAQ